MAPTQKKEAREEVAGELRPCGRLMVRKRHTPIDLPISSEWVTKPGACTLPFGQVIQVIPFIHARSKIAHSSSTLANLDARQSELHVLCERPAAATTDSSSLLVKSTNLPESQDHSSTLFRNLNRLLLPFSPLAMSGVALKF